VANDAKGRLILMGNTTELRVPPPDAESLDLRITAADLAERSRCTDGDVDADVLAAWPPPSADNDPQIPVYVVLLPDSCYRCDGATALVVGIWLEPQVVDDGYEHSLREECGGWFLEYDQESADLIACACPDDLLSAHCAGPLRWRTTRQRPDGFLANTCRYCGAVFGNWPLHEAVVEYQSDGGFLLDLLVVRSCLARSALERF
jgi:hypothetical protein